MQFYTKFIWFVMRSWSIIIVFCWYDLTESLIISLLCQQQESDYFCHSEFSSRFTIDNEFQSMSEMFLLVFIFMLTDDIMLNNRENHSRVWVRKLRHKLIRILHADNFILVNSLLPFHRARQKIIKYANYLQINMSCINHSLHNT